MESAKHFSEAYKIFILEIADNFAQNINRQIVNDIERNKNSKFTPRQLQNAASTKHESSLLLENIFLSTPVIFHSPYVDVDLYNESCTIDLEINDLRIDADSTTLNNEFFDLQITQFSKIEFHLHGICLKGKIGLFIKEDSFMPTHYDIGYSFKEIETKITGGAPVGQPCEHNCYNVKYAVDKVSTTRIEDSMLTYIWVELQQYIGERLQRLIAGIIVDYSFSELFLDEPEEYRELEHDRIQLANNKFDMHLDNIKKEFIKDAELTVAESPLAVCFKSGGELCKLITSACHLNDLNTITRVADASSYEDEHEKSYYGHVTLNTFSFVFDNFNLTSPSKDDITGCIKLAPARHKFFVKFQTMKAASQGSCKATLKIIVLEDVQAVEQILNDHDSHAFQFTLGNLMPYLLGYLRFYSNHILQTYVNNFNYHYRDRN